MTWITPPVKAVGDILYAADINALGGDLTLLAHPPLAAGYKTIFISVPNATETLVNPGVKLLDQDPTGNIIYDPPSGVWTIRTAGLYSAEGQVQYTANGQTAGNCQAYLKKNGTQITQGILPTANVTQGVPFSLPVQRFSVGDTLQMFAWQSSTATRNTDTQGEGVFMALRFEGL